MRCVLSYSLWYLYSSAVVVANNYSRVFEDAGFFQFESSYFYFRRILYFLFPINFHIFCFLLITVKYSIIILCTEATIKFKISSVCSQSLCFLAQLLPQAYSYKNRLPTQTLSCWTFITIVQWMKLHYQVQTSFHENILVCLNHFKVIIKNHTININDLYFQMFN